MIEFSKKFARVWAGRTRLQTASTRKRTLDSRQSLLSGGNQIFLSQKEGFKKRLAINFKENVEKQRDTSKLISRGIWLFDPILA
jgi:hypothetical protein